MTDPEADAPEYVVEHVRQAITTRTSEQGIGVRVVADEVFLWGEVTSRERRDAAGAAAAVAAPGHTIHNDVAVVEPDDHHTTERLT